MNRIKTLRVLLIIVLALLAIQYEFGMTVNISNPAPIPAFGLSLSAVSDAVNGIGPILQVHATIGSLLLLLSLAILILSLASRVRGAQIFGVLGFLSILLAAYGGLMFVLSGFQNDGQSHNMATNFLLSFAFYFVELYVLKGVGE